MKLTGVRQNNLKNLSLELPLEEFICITGPSGSGKSSLAFDTIYAEGYRRYVESLSTYARQFFEKVAKPDVDAIENISPSIALQQKNMVRNSRSTVGTSTEVYDYLRLLFAKLSQIHCPECGKLIQAETPQTASDQILGKLGNKSDRAYLGYYLPEKQKADRLIERGFLRGLKSAAKPDPFQLEELRGKSLKEGSLIIFDRLVVSHNERHRLIESLEGSFREGRGKAFIYLLSNKKFYKFSSEFKCAACNTTVLKPSPLLFSFNSPYGACSHCKGFGNTLEYDEKLIIPQQRLGIGRGAVDPFTKPMMRKAQKKLFDFAKAKKISLDEPYSLLTEKERQLLLYGEGKYKGIIGAFKAKERKKYKLHVRVFLRRYQSAFPCPKCEGARLRKEALYATVKGKNIFELASMSLEDLEAWFLKLNWSQTEKAINKEILGQIKSRLYFLNHMGLGYLSLARLSRTLSGGETQRITLANQLGSELSGTLYVLDEPSIGLHPVDRDRLLESLRELVDRGNSVIVVEHDIDTIKNAQTVLELGPGSGRFGGEVIFQGDMKKFKESSTLTAKYLKGALKIPLPKKRREGSSYWLSVQGATENNLQDVSLKIPLHKFVGICGVSGSGKSSLIHQTLYNALARLFYQSSEPMGRFKKLFGADRIRGVSLLDQTPIGKSARSIPLTIISAYDEVRSLYAQTAKAQSLGLAPRDFSFNVSGGRCEVCLGEGVVQTEMYFLDDLYLTCEECDGKRFKKDVLAVKIRGKNIYDLLQMSVTDAKNFLRDSKKFNERMELLEKVGLGYLQLGQSSRTLSGGESQRLKIAAELLNQKSQNVLYILDEPTTGLHPSEIGLLIQILQGLVDQGNTVIVIEHNIDVLKCVDWLIELGPGAGKNGGKIVAEGNPEMIAKSNTKTARFLRKAVTH